MGKLLSFVLAAGLLLYCEAGSAVSRHWPGMWMTNGPVFSSVTDGNAVYIGGDFTYVGPRTGPGALVDTTSGAVIPDFPLVTGAGAPTVTAAIPDGEGGWYISGTFSSVGGVQRTNLVRIKSDNTVDILFNPSPDGTVLALTLSKDRSVLYVAGSFTSIAGVPRNRLAALNVADGSATAWNPGADNLVRTIALSSNGLTLFVGGDFNNIGGMLRNHLAEVSTVDASVTAWNPNADNIVRTLFLSGFNLYVGGDFTSVSGVTRNHAAVLKTSDGTATGWDPDINAAVRTMVLSLDRAILYLGGDFTFVNGTTPRNYLAAIKTANGLVTPWNPGPDNIIRVVTRLRDNLVVAGDFTTIGGAARHHLAELDVTIDIDNATSWQPSVETQKIVQTLVVAADRSTMLVGGQFDSVGGVQRNRLAALDAISGSATGWNPNANAPVRALALSADGSIVYAGGDFSSIGAQTRHRMAALDSVSGSTTAWDPDVNATVRALTLAVDGSIIYAAGDFTSVNGLTVTRNRLAAFDTTSNTNNATAWDPNADSTARALTLSADGSIIYAGGDFTLIGSQARNRIAALEATLGTATAWNPDINAPVRALVLSNSGNVLYAGGDFTAANGLTVVRNHLAAFDTTSNTNNATVWDPNSDNSVHALALSGNGTTLYAGGDFTFVNGQAHDRLAVVDAVTAAADPAWDPSVNGVVETLTFLDNFKLLVAGGLFTQVGSGVRVGLAGFDFQGPVTVPNPPGAIYNIQQKVRLDCTDLAGSGCANTFFTLDGSDPVSVDGQTPGSPSTILFSRAITIRADSLIKFFSLDQTGNREPIKAAQYFIDGDAPVTTVNPPGNQVFMSQKLEITLACSDGAGTGCVDIFYTLDGSTPTTSSTRYRGPIVIKDSTVLKFFSLDNAGNEEPIQRKSYVNTYGGIGLIDWPLLAMLIVGLMATGVGRFRSLLRVDRFLYRPLPEQ